MLFFLNARHMFRADKIHYYISFQNKKECITKNGTVSRRQDAWSGALLTEAGLLLVKGRVFAGSPCTQVKDPKVSSHGGLKVSLSPTEIHISLPNWHIPILPAITVSIHGNNYASPLEFIHSENIY